MRNSYLSYMYPNTECKTSYMPLAAKMAAEIPPKAFSLPEPSLTPSSLPSNKFFLKSVWRERRGSGEGKGHRLSAIMPIPAGLKEERAYSRAARLTRVLSHVQACWALLSKVSHALSLLQTSSCCQGDWWPRLLAMHSWLPVQPDKGSYPSVLLLRIATHPPPPFLKWITPIFIPSFPPTSVHRWRYHCNSRMIRE